MYARIMAGIDDQFATSTVFATALALARQFDAKLALCHALDQTPLAQHGARVALPDGVAPVAPQRGYAGRVLQLITGSTGLDDWEWGVTLLADDPVALKEIVYEMRFDEVSARYAEFGPFVTGLVHDPAETLRRVGLTA